ncbi:MAG: CHASE4 domain-containing protein, partial [Planctomycetota bacterium]
HDMAVAQHRLELLEHELQQQLSIISGLVLDWAEWDDAYEFLLHPDDAFIRTNMPANFHRDQQLQVVAFIRKDGTVVYLTWFDLQRDRYLPRVPAGVAERLRTVLAERPMHGYLTMADSLLQVAARPVASSDGTGAYIGNVAFARLLDAAVLRELGAVAQLDLRLEPLLQDRPEAIVLEPLSESRLAGSIRLRDLHGQAVAQISTTLPRDIYQDGVRSMLAVQGMIWSLGLLLIALMAWQLHHHLGRPLRALSAGVNRLRAGAFDQPVELAGNNELAQLAAAFNSMTASLDQRYEAIFANTGAATCIIDEQGMVRLANAEFRRLFEFDDDQALPCIFELIHGEDRDQVKQNHFRRRKPGQHDIPNQYRMRICTGSGQQRLVAISVGFIAETSESVVSLVDLTELERNRQAMMRSSQLAAMGTLAGGVAHEFNNLTAAIRAAAEGLLRFASLPENHACLLGNIIQGTDRAQMIAATLESFAGEPLEARGPYELPNLIDETLVLLRTAVEGGGIQLQVELREVPPLPLVLSQMRQVVFALVSNAIESFPDETSERRVTIRNGREGNWQWFSVADNGCGISSEDIQHIFLPFFTRKNTLYGTEQSGVGGIGLGLSVADTVTRQHGGRIDVDSVLGKGSCFTVRLPESQRY